MTKRAKTLEDAIRAEMKRRDEGVAAFAARAGMSHQALGHVLAGNNCTAITLKKLEIASDGRIGLKNVEPSTKGRTT